MLEDRNNTMIFLWEIYSIFMQISSIVLVLQHGRRAHTLYSYSNAPLYKIEIKVLASKDRENSILIVRTAITVIRSQGLYLNRILTGKCHKVKF